ncbi:MAG: hypothetical protein AMXMBFR78_33400 [Rubrivivax sp.]
MSLLDKLSLRAKLLLAPLACLCLMVLAAAGAVWGFAQQREALDSLHTQRLPSYAFAAQFESGLRDLNGLINRAIGYAALGYNEKEIAAVDKTLLATSAAMHKALAQHDKDARGDEERALVQALAAGFGKYDKAIAGVLEMREAGAALAVTYLTTAQSEYEGLLAQISKITKARLDAAGEDVATARKAAQNAQMAIAASAAVAVIAGIGLSLLLAQGLLRRMRSASSAVERLAAGDLCEPVQTQGRDEVGRLLGDVEAVRVRLADAIRLVQEASESVKCAASEIASGNADLSQRTEQQASNLQQTAASMEELSGTIRNNAESAGTASRLAQSASSVAGRGGSVVGQVVSTMTEISDSSRRIADIIGTIDGIAFQTNILALNAAVEAARAGEQGRGFAVVASEVRSLAQRSAQAAREIKALIGTSVEKVEAGTRLVGEAGSTMQDIVEQVKRVSDLIAEISSASEQQTAGVGQVSDAVTQLDTVTQQNAALVEQSAAAAESLRQQAHRLVEAVAVFKVEGAPA